MNGRGDHGRFMRENEFASRGGQARADRLPPERRREIAKVGGRRGFAALVAKWFAGDVEAAKRFIGQRGAWAADVAAYGDDPRIAKPAAYPRPLAPWELAARIAPECQGYEDQVDAAARGLIPCPF